MNSFKLRQEQALDACDKVINGIEDGTLSVSSSLLLCKKIARLINDYEGLEWLNYEYGGYPRTSNGKVDHDAWKIAADHGRSYMIKDESGNHKNIIFTELCGELEEIIKSCEKAIGNYSTQGFSVSSEHAVGATDRMTLRVAQGTNGLIGKVSESVKHLSILKSQYYDYAVKWQIEMRFGNVAKTIFEEYQERIGQSYSVLPVQVIQKLNAIEDMLEDGDPERYSQILTSCRRLWAAVANHLFEIVLPGFEGKSFKTHSNKNIDISGDHFNNKISAVIETLQSKSAKNTLIGSETIYLVDWIEQINALQNAGVHRNVTRDEAIRCIIHTYIALGDILSLKKSVETQDTVGDEAQGIPLS